MTLLRSFAGLHGALRTRHSAEVISTCEMPGEGKNVHGLEGLALPDPIPAYAGPDAEKNTSPHLVEVPLVPNPLELSRGLEGEQEAESYLMAVTGQGCTIVRP